MLVFALRSYWVSRLLLGRGLTHLGLNPRQALAPHNVAAQA